MAASEPPVAEIDPQLAEPPVGTAVGDDRDRKIDPPRLTVEKALAAAGEDAVYYGTKLRGASNAKAKRVFGFRPRRLEWLTA